MTGTRPGDAATWLGRLATGCGLLLVTSFTSASGLSPALDVAVAPPTSVGGAIAPDPDAAHAGASPPVALEVPGIDVRTLLIGLGRTPFGAMEVPEDFDVAGWYTGGAGLGEPGPVVVAGHVDSFDGPAVFWRLAELEPGAHVHVVGADGRRFIYEVERVEQFAKESFPAVEVFGVTDEAVLRLVTCGGFFDRRGRSYDDNVIVFARLVGEDAP